MKWILKDKVFTTRVCRQSDYRFYYVIMKETMFPLISQYKKLDMHFFRSTFLKSYSQIQILLRGKKRIGFFQLTPKKSSTLDIEKIFFSKGYRGKGYGTAFFEALESQGYKRLILQVWENNPARKLYKKLGFTQIKKKDHKITMEKVL